MISRRVSGSFNKGLPPYPLKGDWRHTAQITHFGGSCYDSRNSATRTKDVKRRIQEIHDEGYNTMMIDGWHMWPCFQDKLEEWKLLSAQQVEIAHGLGIRVIEHFDVPCLVYANTGFNFLLKSLDMCQRNIQYGEPTMRMFCLNNPDFRHLFLTFLEDYARFTQIDAFMLDECTFAGKDFCGCQHCRKLFTKATGKVLPLECDSDVFDNMQSPLWISWLKWRRTSIGNWWQDVKTTLQRANPNTTIMKYITHYGFSSNWAPIELGIDLMESSKACGFLGTEIMTRNIMNANRSVNAYRKLKQPLTRQSKTPLFGFTYHMENPVTAYFSWALLHMNNQICLADAIPNVNTDYYVKWAGQMQKDAVEEVVEIGILFSRQTRDFGDGDDHRDESIGLSQSLTDAHIMHEFIYDEEVLLDALKKYHVLILPNALCLSDKQLLHIKYYMETGGTVLITGRTGTCNEDGFTREIHGFATLIELGSKDEALNTTKTPLGKGHLIACPQTHGITNFEPEFAVGNEWTYQRENKAHEKSIAIIEALLTTPTFKSLSMPEKVMASLYSKQGEPTLILNLLNTSGVSMKRGDTLTSEQATPAFPELHSDLIFEIKANNIESAVVASPDYPEEHQLPVEPSINGYQKITLSKDFLRVHASITITHDNS